MIVKNKKLITILVFFVIFIIGSLNFKHYGIHWDSEVQRKIGFINGNYILKLFLSENKYDDIFQNLTSPKFSKKTITNNSFDFKDYFENVYGAGFELPSAAIETFFKIKDFQDVFLLRHYMNFLFFFISLIFFFKFINYKFKSHIFGIIAIFFIVLNPRIFVESFYNSKDIIFMSSIIFSNYFGYKLIKKFKTKNLILFALMTGFAASIRIIGVVNIPLFIFLLILNNKKIETLNIILISCLSLGFFYIMYPYLWENPLLNLINSIKFFSEHSRSLDVFYFGEFINSQNLPWHYLPVWIFITIPEAIIIFFILGVFLILKNFFIKKKINEEFLFFIFQIFIPIFIPIILGSTLYDGWRQFYFIYPAIIIVSLYFLESLKNKKFLIANILIVMNLVFVCFWSIKNHPYQYLYFNNFVNKPLKFFEKDFWGLSNKQLLDYVSTLEKDKIYYDFIGSNFKSSIKFQNEKNKNKYIYIKDTSDKIDEYYVFVNNRFIDPKKIKLLRNSKNFIREIIIDNTYINGVYKVSLNN